MSYLEKIWARYSGQFKCTFDNLTHKISLTSEMSLLTVKTQTSILQKFWVFPKTNPQNATLDILKAVVIRLPKDSPLDTETFFSQNPNFFENGTSKFIQTLLKISPRSRLIYANKPENLPVKFGKNLLIRLFWREFRPPICSSGYSECHFDNRDKKNSARDELFWVL